MRVTPFSKGWWNKNISEAWKIWAKEKKLWGKTSPNRENLKKVRKRFYRTVRRAKREYWRKFLLGEEELEGDPAKIHVEDKNQYWKALKYTKTRANRTTPTLYGPNNEVTFTMQTKEALIRAHAFLKALTSQNSKYQPKQGSAYLTVSEETVARALLCQSVKKAPGPNKYNFQALQLM